jgi:hypothetical protein
MEIALTKDQRIAFARFGDVTVTVYGPRPWPDETFREYLKMTTQFPGLHASLVLMTKATPTSKQREEAGALVGPEMRNHRIAILTDSTLARWAANAFAALQRGKDGTMTIRAFAPDATQDALLWSLERKAAPDARPLLKEMMAAVGYDAGAIALFTSLQSQTSASSSSH